MNKSTEFRNTINTVLQGFDPELLSYDESEFWMIRSTYDYIEFYALNNGLYNTAIALPLARGLHNGSHRKSSIIKNGVSYRLPYVIHCLRVCRMLADIQIPLPREEEDIVLAAALCHDMIEDIPFLDHGKELYTKFHMDKRVYDTVKQVSKRKDFTPEEEAAFFHGIESNKLALLVKLSDRSNNVEDLYNMSTWKVHEYIRETESFFHPMCTYGLAHYPELAQSIELLQDKIIGLTQASMILVDRCEEREQELLRRYETVKAENERLHKQFQALWEG